MINTANVDIRKLESLTLKVRITTELKVRARIASFFIHCAALALGAKSEVEIKDV